MIEKWRRRREAENRLRKRLILLDLQATRIHGVYSFLEPADRCDIVSEHRRRKAQVLIRQLDGFQFEWSRPSVNHKDGLLTVQVLVIAYSEDEAENVMISNISGSLKGVTLVKHSADVLKRARALGIDEGQGLILNPDGDWVD